MRLFTAGFICIACLAGVSQDEAKPIPAADALKHIGKPHVLVEMTVKAAKDRLKKRGIVYLDSDEDFASPNNLGVAVSAEGAAAFKKHGVADVAAHFKGKTIRVRGCIMRFEEPPYLPVHDPKQIELVKER